MMKRMLILAAAAALIAAGAPALAESMPSSKASVAMGDLTALSLAPVNQALNSTDTAWTTVLASHIKTANDKELAFDVALQCGLVTYTAVKSKGGKRDTANASGTIKIRVKVTDEDGNERFAGPNEGNDPDRGVTYCHRTQELSAVFQGLIEDCIDEFGAINLDDSCLEPEEVSLMLSTLNANAFNFLLANVHSGIQHIEVQAKAETSADFGLGDAYGEAFVGLGSMHVESTRLISGDEGLSEF